MRINLETTLMKSIMKSSSNTQLTISLYLDPSLFPVAFLLRYLFNVRSLPCSFTLPGKALPSVHVSNSLESHWVWLTPAVARTRLTQRVVIGIQIPAGSEKVTEGLHGGFGVVSAGWLISKSMKITSHKLLLFVVFSFSFYTLRCFKNIFS